MTGLIFSLKKQGFALPHLGIFYLIHVGIVEILAAHTPNEHVVGGTGSAVDRPLGRNHRLLVLHPYKTVLWGSPMMWQIVLPGVRLK